MIVRISRYMGQSPAATLEMDERWWLAAQRAEERDWPMQTELLALIVDKLNELIFVTVKLHRPKASVQQPKPIRRPWEPEKQGLRMRALDFARSQVPPKRRKGVND